MIRSRVVTACCAGSMLLCMQANAGVFIPFDGRAADQVVHPRGYAGAGASLNISVCLDSAAPPPGGAAQAEQTVRNVVAEFNRLQGATGNVIANPSPGDDFESVLLHEVGHCVGMGHTVFGPSEVGNGSPQLYFPNAMRGTNGVADTNAGVDGVRGTRDDARGDDININWFQVGSNSPWAALPSVIDRATFSVDLSDLPNGYNFVEVASAFAPCSPGAAANSSALYSEAATQNAMYPVVCSNNLLRKLALDDVALMRIARAGADGTQGTADDYSATLAYAGQASSCDIRISFNSTTGYANCGIGGTGGGGLGNDIAITTAQVNFNENVDWVYNQTDTTGAATPEADLSISKTSTAAVFAPGDTVDFTITVANAGPDNAQAVQVTDPLPAGLSFVSITGACATFPCNLGTLISGVQVVVTARYTVGVNVTDGQTITNTASVSSGTDDPDASDNASSRQITIDVPAGGPVGCDVDVDCVFLDGFEQQP